MLKTKIKASQIANLTDARYFAAMGADLLGFSLDPASESYTDPKKVGEIRDWVEGPAIVGEFGVATVDSIREAHKLLKLDMVQVGPFQNANVLGLLDGIPIIKEIVIDGFTDAQEVAALCGDTTKFVKYFILDFFKNGISWSDLKSESGFELSILKEICQKHSVLLSIDVVPEEVEELLSTLQPAGLSVFGGEEELVGVKSFDDLDELFDQLMIE